MIPTTPSTGQRPAACHDPARGDPNWGFVGAGIAALLALSTLACAGAPEPIYVVAAASLRPALEQVLTRPPLSPYASRIRLQTGGSAALARRVHELELRADLVLLADLALIREQLLDDWSEFAVGFLTNRLVLGRSATARATELLPDRWPEALRRPGVVIGRGDPDTAPIGYRTLLALRLWDLDHPENRLEQAVLRASARGVRPDVASLLAPLQAGAFDYAFLYASTAVAAAIPYIDLPPEIDLGHPEYAARYERARVQVAGAGRSSTRVRIGGPILYGASLRRGAGPTAEHLLEALLQESVHEGFAPYGFGVPRPLRWIGTVPARLRASIR